MLIAGDRAPGFELDALEGGRRSFGAEGTNRPVLLAFFALDCATCDICYLFWDRFHEQYGSAGCELWAIGLDEPADLERFVERSGVEFPVLVDTALETVRAFGAISTPALFLVREDGTIEAAHEGFERAAFNDICRVASEWTGAPLLEVASAEGPELRPGCTIHGL